MAAHIHSTGYTHLKFYLKEKDRVEQVETVQDSHGPNLRRQCLIFSVNQHLSEAAQ